MEQAPDEARRRVVSDNPGGLASRPAHQDSSRSTSGGFLIQPLRRVSKRKSDVPNSFHPPHVPETNGHAQNSQNESPSFQSSRPSDSPSASADVGSSDHLPISKRRKGKQKKHQALDTSSPRISNVSSPLQSSSTSASTAAPSSSQIEGSSDAGPTQQPAIDPAQIVRMALSLNESRRMNFSPGNLAPSSPSLAARRVTSAAIAPPPTSSLQANLGDYRESLRQSLEPRSASPNLSTPPRTSYSPQPKSISFGEPAAQGTPQSVGHRDQEFPMAFSAATISRAEKARNFIELHDQYRRLLQFLPPLHPRSHSKKPHELGREYNPLQHIRNRRVRSHEQALLDPDGAGWNDVEAVKAWVDGVESNADSSEYRKGEEVRLPLWHKTGSDQVQDQDAEAAPLNVTSPRTKRPALDWTFQPAGLLADAYWLEHDSNKGLIEKHDGNKLFPRLQPSKNRKSLDSARTSHESNRDFIAGNFSSPDSNIKQSPTSQDDIVSSPVDNLTNGVGEISPTGNNGSGKRRFLRRRKDLSLVDSHDSDDESIGRRQTISLGRKLGINIGPLEKHMMSMLKGESSNDAEVALDSLQPHSVVREEGQQRRGGVSSDRQDAEESPDVSFQPQSYGSPRSHNLRASLGSEPPTTPRISIDDFDSMKRPPNSSTAEESTQSPLQHSKPPTPKAKQRARRFSLFHRRSKSKELNKVEETDFALDREVPAARASLEVKSSPASSLRSRSRTDSLRNLSSPIYSRRQSTSKSNEIDNSTEKESSPAGVASRFFKAGRIGELVRSELGRQHDSSSRNSIKRTDSIPSVMTGTASTQSDSENEAGNDDGVYLSVGNATHKRSRSTNDLKKSDSYDSRMLPTFRSAHAPPTTEELRPITSAGEDHISRQMRQQKDKHSRTKSRFGKLSPLSIDTSPSVSPTSSFTDLTQQATNNDSLRTARSQAQHSSPYDRSVVSAGERLNKILREPGGVGRGGLPITGLSRVDPATRVGSRRAAAQHSWYALAHEAEGEKLEEEKELQDNEEEDSAVTAKDIQRLKALLLSSGVKAQAIVRRANSTQIPTSKFLLDAAETAKMTVPPQIRRQEHVVAAKILSTNLEEAASAFENLASQFRNEACQSLHARLDDLRDRAHSDLSLRIQSCGDDADGFVGKLTTAHTLAVQQLNDSVDRMLRSRWRRLRWLNRAGFKMLEWLLVGFMWFIWAFVWILKIIKGTVVGVIHGTRWLFGI